MHLVKEAQCHGIKYMAKSKHRCLWAMLLFILMVCSIIVTWIWIQRYLENPTYIVQLESTREERPFPAVVLCPEVAFADHRIELFVKHLKYPSHYNETYAKKVIRQIAAFFAPDVKYRLSDLKNIQSILDYNNIDIETAGLSLTESCEESITRCRWEGEIVNCSTLFHMTLTAYGFCCNFNGRSLKREMMNRHSQNKKTFQKLHIDSGFSRGLMLVINQSLAAPFDVDLSYKWISIHSAQRYIDLPGNGTPIAPGAELFVGFTTVDRHVDEEAVNLNKELRRCRMSHEALKYFPVYHKYHYLKFNLDLKVVEHYIRSFTTANLSTEINLMPGIQKKGDQYCLLESEMQRTVKLCGCLKIGHLRLPGVPVCRAQNLHCARAATLSLGKRDYDCLPTCDAEIDRTKLQTFELDPTSSPYDSFYDNLDFKTVSIVRIYVLNQNRKIFSTKPYFTKFQLFAQLGGEFNMFFGCSVLSIFEVVMIIYHAFRARM